MRARWSLGALSQRVLAGVVGTFAALLTLELAMRLMVLFDPMPTSELRKTEQLVPPAPDKDCSSPQSRATLGQILKPSSVPGLVYEFKPNTQGCYRGGYHLANRDGQRSRSFEPFARPKPQDTFRFVLLGDSYAYGQSVPYEGTFGAELERLLTAKHAGRRVEVINAGVPGYNTAQEAAYLEARGMSYEPDCIVVIFVSNDLGLPFLMLEPRNPFTLRRSYVFEALGSWLSRRSGETPTIPPGMTQAEGIHSIFVRSDELDRIPEQYRYMVGIEGYKRALQSIVSTAKQVPVVNVADYSDVHGSGAAEQRDLVDYQQKIGIHHAFVPIQRDKGLWVGPDDSHPNARGQAIMAGQLVRFLEERKLCLP
jgi:lysophospholipase L1-like esterase